MKVAELIGVRQFRLSDAPIAEPGPGEIQIEVRAVGICGSDVHAYAEGAIGDMACIYPMVLGHEPAGVVAKIGPGVTGWSLGDPAALEPAHYCYHCEQCLHGRHNICAKLRFLSTPGEPGFFRERVNLPVENLLALPPRLPLTVATLVEPLAVCLHALELGRPRPGESAVVLGAGPIGLLTIAALRRTGLRTIYAIEPLAHRRELAKAMGADSVLELGGRDLVRTLLSETAGRGVDLVVDCAAKGGSEGVSLELAANGGRVVFVGIPSELRVPLDVHLWRRKELSVHQVRRSNHDGPAARDWIARDARFFSPLITHERPLEGLSAAFHTVENYEDGVGKLVVRLDR